MKKVLTLLVALLPLLILTSCDDKAGTDGGATESAVFFTLTIENGEHTTTEKVKEGAEYTLPTPDGTSCFKGWAVNGDDENLKNAGEKITLTADTTITSHWDDTKCTVTLDYNYEGSGLIHYADIEKGGQIETPRAPTRLGYSFKYWSTDKEGNEQKGDYPSQFLGDFEGNTTLYAQWEEGYATGYTFTLGTYPDDPEHTGNEWRVLSYDKDNKKVLVISGPLLDTLAHADDTSKTYKWSESNINAWLNSTEDDGFIKKYGLEDVPMAAVEHITEEGADESKQPEETSNEKVFLLSKEEAGKYFSTDSERKASGGPNFRDNYWWLRTPGADTSKVCCVNFNGTIYDSAPVDGKELGDILFKVRPAFWIDLQSVL